MGIGPHLKAMVMGTVFTGVAVAFSYVVPHALRTAGSAIEETHEVPPADAETSTPKPLEVVVRPSPAGEPEKRRIRSGRGARLERPQTVDAAGVDLPTKGTRGDPVTAGGAEPEPSDGGGADEPARPGPLEPSPEGPSEPDPSPRPQQPASDPDDGSEGSSKGGKGKGKAHGHDIGHGTGNDDKHEPRDDSGTSSEGKTKPPGSKGSDEHGGKDKGKERGEG